MRRTRLESIGLHLKRYQEMINDRLNQYIPEQDVPEKTIYQAMRYSLLNGGKRIRPILTLAVAEMFNGKIDDVMPFACAIEMIHTYSLIHDDLPAMDNDEYRRGRLTNHKVFGEGIAILAGDALLNKAYEIIISELEDKRNLERKIKAAAEIAAASGSSGMIGGQVIDLESEGRLITQETLRYMHKKKTGSLIVASAKVGAIIAGANDEDLKNVHNYAENIGLAFQIRDDILAEIGDQSKLGKKVGNDREKMKSTYVTVMGLEKAEILLNTITNSALKAVEPYGERAAFFVELAKYLLRREN